MIQSLNFANEDILEKIENKDLVCNIFTKSYYEPEKLRHYRGKQLSITKKTQSSFQEHIDKVENPKAMKKEIKQQLNNEAQGYLTKRENEYNKMKQDELRLKKQQKYNL